MEIRRPLSRLQCAKPEAGRAGLTLAHRRSSISAIRNHDQWKVCGEFALRATAVHYASDRPTVSMAERLQESLRHCRMARRTPMTTGKKMNRIGHHVVEIDANMRKLAKDRRGKVEFRAKEIACALMGQDHPHALRCFFPDSAQDETDNFDRLFRIQALGNRLTG